MNYITCKDIEEHTGLDYYYILKVVKALDNVFTEELIKRGSNNSLLFSSENAYTIFDRVKQLKDKRFNIRQIKQDFENSFNQNTVKPHTKEFKENKTESKDNIFLDKFEELNKRNDQLFNELIKTQDMLVKTLLLPAGKDEREIIKLETENKLLKESKEKLDKIKPLVKNLYDLENNLLSFANSNQKKNIILEIFKILM